MSGPHIPTTTSAGHFLSMQPSTVNTPIDKVWYRGDEFLSTVAKSDKYQYALHRVLAIFADPTESGDADTQLKILDIVEEALK